MELAVYIGCAVLLVLVVVMSLARREPRGARLLAGERLHTEAADVEIEAVDIDEMIEARNQIRRRTGREEIGEELGREALRRPPAS